MIGCAIMRKHPIDDLMKIYLAEKDVTKRTKDLYETILKQYSLYLKDQKILYAKTRDVKDYISQKKNQAYSPAWIYQQISTIKNFYAWLSGNQKRLGLKDIYSQDITEAIKNVHVKKFGYKQALTLDQAKQLINCLKHKRKYIWHYRDYAMIYLMITTGMRSVEIRRARKRDLRVLQGQVILEVQGKGRQAKDAFVKVPKGVHSAIKDYLEKRKDQNPYLFVSHSRGRDMPYLSRSFFLRMFRRVLRECGLAHTKFTPHALRHTAATLNLQRGASLESTRRLMRHVSLSSTLVYAHHINQMMDDSSKRLEQYILKERSTSNQYHWQYIVLDF